MHTHAALSLETRAHDPSDATPDSLHRTKLADVPGFVNALLEKPVPNLNLKGFAVGDGWTGCAPVAGKPVPWCLDLDNVGTFVYPNVHPGVCTLCAHTATRRPICRRLC